MRYSSILFFLVFVLALQSNIHAESNSDTMCANALDMIENKEYDDAIELCNEILSSYPDNSNALAYRGRAYLIRGRGYSDKDEFEKAIVDFTKAIELYPDYIDAYRYRGEAYEALGKTNLAKKDAKKVSELEPKDSIFDFGFGFNPNDSPADSKETKFNNEILIITFIIVFSFSIISLIFFLRRKGE